jgi:hypothetical protein
MEWTSGAGFLRWQQMRFITKLDDISNTLPFQVHNGHIFKCVSVLARRPPPTLSGRWTKNMFPADPAEPRTYRQLHREAQGRGRGQERHGGHAGDTREWNGTSNKRAKN